ncbi:hypothetical protein U2066_15295, partial [Listeria monocytogenes]|uniref:hypothetical protein n=1 Tax=Listeria monocytogenes TaxID=1639 RepID=UPI002FDC372A
EIVMRVRPGLAALTFWSAVCAAEPGPQAERPAEPEIVVTGRGIEALDRYVEELTEIRPGGQLARWNDPVCPRAVGLEAGQN